MYTVTIYKNNTKQTLYFTLEQEAIAVMQQVQPSLGYHGGAYMFKGAELVRTMLPY